ncbi:hypothetical protein GTZ97_03795 [Aquabacterium fontiphilum]|uniref:hypothetical protein n=1 Tax=Aquabacterium fontiphilum TaxID=450365 RepID=UPI001376E0CE|nr:hypothetical protein [Aquabacterium fontiphilum]NBD19794.1 hypothetical protein [Aquabacterium fontiphilum]
MRANHWKTTKVFSTSQGVIQHLGDEAFDGGIVKFLPQTLAPALHARNARTIVIKTFDVRLSLPDTTKADPVMTSTLVSMHGLIALPMIELMNQFSRNKTASAVICVNVDGNDYLGNDSNIFMWGAQEELENSIHRAIKILSKNIIQGEKTLSPACEPGWEGGQPNTLN